MGGFVQYWDAAWKINLVVSSLHRSPQWNHMASLYRAGRGTLCVLCSQDFSHHTVVCEAGPGDRCLDEAVREIVPRVHHIHARIGYENSPQVPLTCMSR